MQIHRIGVAFVLVGMAMEACSSSSSNSQPGDAGPGATPSDGATDVNLVIFPDSSSLSTTPDAGSTLGADSGSSTGNDSGSSTGDATVDGGSSTGTDSGSSTADTGVDTGASTSAGYAIPLASPGGADFEYTAVTTVGDQSFVMSIDTGSSTAALAGTSCTGCTAVTPLYTPSSSATASGQKASSTYEDGSSWSGPIYTDTVGLGEGSPSVSLALADITKARSFFSGQNDYQGILGLGPTQNVVNGTTAYMPAVMAAGVANVFAFQLCDGTGANAGTMWLGGNGGFGSVVYTPLVAISDNNPYYAINVDSMSLGGTSIVTNASATFEQPVLDTGTSLFYVPTSVFNSFQTALEASSGFKAVFGTATFATSGQNEGCVTDSSVTDAQVESMLPQIALSLPSVTSGQPDVTMKTSALDTYLYNGGSGSYCLAIQDGGTQDPSTFGDAFMQAFGISVDLGAQQIGFGATGCEAPQIHHVRHPARVGPHRPARPNR